MNRKAIRTDRKLYRGEQLPEKKDGDSTGF